MFFGYEAIFLNRAGFTEAPTPEYDGEPWTRRGTRIAGTSSVDGCLQPLLRSDPGESRSAWAPGTWCWR